MPIKREKGLPRHMTKEEFLDYVRSNFIISVEAQYLIKNILDYVETIPVKEQKNALQKLLGFSIGLTNKEINTITFDKSSEH